MSSHRALRKARLLGLGENRVELALGLLKHGDRVVPVLRVAFERDLLQRHHDAADRLAGVVAGGHGLIAELGPRRVLGGRRRLGLSGLGQRIGLPARARVALDQALVLEHLQRRIDRAWARPPHAAGPLIEFLDHLVPVHGPLVEQRQDRGAYVAAAPVTSVMTARAERTAKRTTKARAGWKWRPEAAAPRTSRPIMCPLVWVVSMLVAHHGPPFDCSHVCRRYIDNVSATSRSRTSIASRHMTTVTLDA